MVGETELGEGGEELTTPDVVVVHLIVQCDEGMITDAETLDLRSGEGLCCDREIELFVGARAAGGGDGGGVAHGLSERGRRGSGRVGSEN